MARSLTVISLLFQSTTHCRYRVYTKFLLTYTAIYWRNRKVLPLGITVLQPQSHFHLGTPYKIQYVGDLASSDVSPHSCTSYSARTIFMLWLPSIFWLMYLSKNSFINQGLDLWSVRSGMLAAFVTTCQDG